MTTVHLARYYLVRCACAILAVHGSPEPAAAQRMPESAASEAESRTAYERAYRECPVDSLRGLVRAGASASDVAREYVRTGLLRAGDAVRKAGEPRRYWDEVYVGCLDALTGEPSRYDTVAKAAQIQRAEARRHSQERRSSLGSYAWVFYLDVALGVVLLAAAAGHRHRDDDKTLRRWWMVAAALMGAFFGAAVFVGVGFMAAITMIMSQPSELMLAAMTAMAIAFGAVGMAFSPRGRGRWRAR